MGFAPEKLAVLAYANGFTLWHYDTEDDAQLLVSANYFAVASGMLRRGDLIFSSCLIAGAKKTGLFLVTGVSDGAISVDSLHSATAEDLSNLSDVTLHAVAPSEVLAYDGQAWSNQANPGGIGDTHAAQVGNPHATTAGDVGAVAVAEKGQPLGVASLDADGQIAEAQLRPWALARLRDVLIANPAVGEVLAFNGANWVNAPAPTGGGGPLPAASDADVVLGTATHPQSFSAAQLRLAAHTHAPVDPAATAPIANARLAPVESGTLKGRDIAGSGTPEDLPAERVRAMLGVAAGATAAGAAGDAFALSHPGTGGDSHPAATAAAAGFLTPSDKQKLDAIAANAAANPPLATAPELAAATEMDPRLFSPAQIKAAVLAHLPPPAADSIDNIALANMAAGRLKGRPSTAGLGDPQDLTAAQVRALINVQDGATAAGSAGDSHAAATGNPHQTTAAQTGAIAATDKGVAGGVASLGSDGKVPAAQLPPMSGGVGSVFGRTGSVVPQAGDYTCDQVVETADRKYVSGTEKALLGNGAAIEVAVAVISSAGNSFVMTDATAALQRNHQNGGAKVALDLRGVGSLTFRGRAGTFGPAGFRAAIIFSTDKGSTWLYSDGTPANSVPPANGWASVLATTLDATTALPFAVSVPLHPSLRQQGVIIDVQSVGGDGASDPSIRNGVLYASGFGQPAAAAGGAVASVFGRTGSIGAEPGDYTCDQVTDTAAKVMMTAAERAKLAALPTGATAAGATGDAHAAATGNPHNTTAAHVGAIAAAEKGAAGGVATLDASGKVPATQIASGAGTAIARATETELFDGAINEPRLLSPAQIKSVIRYYGLIGVGDSREAFLASDPTLPHGGVRAANSGAENAAADDALWARVRASTATRRFIQYPAGRLDFKGTWSPSGRTPGKGERADDITVNFPSTTIRCAADSAPADFMPIQLVDDTGAFRDIDTFSHTKAGQMVPWSKDKDTVWIDPATGNLRKMRVLFNIRNCERLNVTGSLILDGNNVPQMVGISSTGGSSDNGGRTGMTRGQIQSLIVRNISVGIMAGNFGANNENTGIADHFTDTTFGQFIANQSVKVAMIGNSNHFDNIKFLAVTTSCAYPSYLSNTHNIYFGPGFWNTPSSMPAGHSHALITMGVNMIMASIYFNAGGHNSDGNFLFCERSVVQMQYHNDIQKGTTTGAHIRVGRAPSGVNCTSADISAQIDIRSVVGMSPPAGGAGWGPNTAWPGMLAIDTAGGLSCRRIIELRCGAQRNDFDIVKIAPGSATTNDKISIFDARDDTNYGRPRRIVNGALALI